MGTAARKARKRAGVPFVRERKLPSAEQVLLALFTPDGMRRPAPDVEADLAKIGTSIAEVHQQMGLDSKPQPRARRGFRRRWAGGSS